jgi:hypothetical protein
MRIEERSRKDEREKKQSNKQVNSNPWISKIQNTEIPEIETKNRETKTK